MKLFSSFIILILPILLLAQSNNLEEVVYLKNGSIIRGIIIEQVPNQNIKIKTKDGNIYTYNYSEVTKITKEPIYAPTPSSNTINQIQQKSIQQSTINDSSRSATNTYTYKEKKEKKEYLKKGFMGATEIGSLFRYGSNKSLFSLNQLIGKRTSQHYSFAMGFGVNVANSILDVPVTLDNRIYFINKQITPFLNIAPGYSFTRFSFNDFYDINFISHSFITNIGAGAEFKLNKNIGFLLNIGARLTLSFYEEDYFGNSNSDFFANGYLKFGITY